MIKPNGYDEVQVGDFIPVELGGHRAVIKKIEEAKSQSGKDMLKVAIDFDATDAQPGYFMEQFKKDVRPDKKYPYNAVQYIVTTDSNGKCSRSFKSFITSFETSNNCKVNWEAKDFCAQFINKKLGVVYGNVEEEYNGEVKKRRRIRWFCDYAKAATQEVPADKLLATKPQVQTDSQGFVNALDPNAGEDIPFPI